MIFVYVRIGQKNETINVLEEVIRMKLNSGEVKGYDNDDTTMEELLKYRY